MPETPGVYQFRDEAGEILYVGKAKNLKNRLNSYFSNRLLPKTAQMVGSASEIFYIKVTSEFEAFLLEANLIKKYKPKYNSELKDDKSPLYIGITKDSYPRVITLRKSEIETSVLKSCYGPYLAGNAARMVLRKIRRTFPYSMHVPTRNICIYKQIGLCDPCPSEIEKTEDRGVKLKLKKKYLRNIGNIKKILSGKLGRVRRELEKEIKELASFQKFEEAGEVARQLDQFNALSMRSEYEVGEYLKNPNLNEDIRLAEIKELIEKLQKGEVPDMKDKLERIECFDIAHLSGSFPSASMVTFGNGEANKKYYRHFKIYGEKSTSDVDSMREVIGRRLKHLTDWGRPDLIIIDGGKPQLGAVWDLLDEEKIPFMGLAKRQETIVVRKKDGTFKEIRATGASLRLLERIRDEAHRFARRLHHQQVYKSIIKE